MKYNYKTVREVGGDCFLLIKMKNDKKTTDEHLSFKIDEFISMFNIDEYYIIKQTTTFRIIDESDLEKYAGVIFFKKSIYSIEYLERWILFLKINKIDTKFLNKPFPPEYMLEKIKIIDEIY